MRWRRGGAGNPGKGLADRVLGLLERVDYRRAETTEEREAIFRLRYQAYLREGAIAPNASERFCDPLDDRTTPGSSGSISRASSQARSGCTSPRGSRPSCRPSTSSPISSSPEIGAGKTIIDPTRFVADRAASRRFPELCYVTTRLAWLASEYFQTSLLLATVRAEHQAFYRRVFGHRLICEPRHYPSLAKPISLMALDYMMARERVPLRHPFFRSTFFERRMLFARTPVAVPMRTAA